MGRPKSSWSEGLPERVGFDRRVGAYRYYRPDTKTQLWLGSDRAVALETVEVLNRFFAYAENGKDFDWGGVGEKAIDLLRKKKFTYLPDNLRDTRLQVFAQKHQAEFAATSEPRIDTEIKADSMPKWAAHLLRQTKKNAATRGFHSSLRGATLPIWWRCRRAAAW